MNIITKKHTREKSSTHTKRAFRPLIASSLVLALSVNYGIADVVNPESATYEESFTTDNNNPGSSTRYAGWDNHWLSYQASIYSGGFYRISRSNADVNTVILTKYSQQYPGGITNNNNSNVMTIKGLGIRVISGSNTPYLFKSGENSAGGTFNLEFQNSVLVGQSYFLQAKGGSKINTLTMNGNYNNDNALESQIGNGYALYNGNAEQTSTVLTLSGTSNTFNTKGLFQGIFNGNAKIYGSIVMNGPSKTYISSDFSETNTSFITGNIRYSGDIGTLKFSNIQSDSVALDGILYESGGTFNLNLGSNGAILKSSIWNQRTLSIYTSSNSDSGKITIDSSSISSVALAEAKNFAYFTQFGGGANQAIFNQGTLKIGKLNSSTTQEDPTQSGYTVSTVDQNVNELEISGKIWNGGNNASGANLTILANTYTHSNGDLINDNGSTTITASTTMTMTGTVKTTGGSVTINAGTTDIAGSISTNWGTASLNTSTARIAGGISTSGTTKITISAPSTQVSRTIDTWPNGLIAPSISTYAGKNIIQFARTSNNLQTSEGGGVSLYAKASGARVGQNFVITQTNTTNDLKFTTITLANDNTNNTDWQSAANYIDLGGTHNTVSIASISTADRNNTNRNIIAKGIVENIDTTPNLKNNFETSWGTQDYQATADITISGDVYAGRGKNFINTSSLILNGYLDSNGSNGSNNIATSNLQANNIRARWGGRNNIIINGSSPSNFSGTITAGGSDLGSGNNYIYFDSSAVANFTSNSSLSAGNGANYISFGNADLANTVSISIVSATNGGKNYLAKNILNNSNGILSQAIGTTGWWASNTNAFTGSLSINSVTSSGSGANFISYNATSLATSAIISNLVTPEDGGAMTLGTAVSGSNNNIYLNVSNSTLGSGVDALQSLITNPVNATQLKGATVILGNVNNSGTTNIKIIGTANTIASDTPSSKTITNKNQIGILGNINTTSGTTNVVLQDTFFAPSAIIVDNTQPSTGKTTMPFGGANAGNITTTSGATTNVVTRFTADVKPTGVSMYSVNGAGTTNVAIQGNIDVGTYINYSNESHVNLIFANASNNTTDSFSSGTTNLENNQILGVTYQNGVKLSITDKTILIGDNNASFLDTYGSYYTDGSTPLATVWANRTDDRDVVAISGLVVGNISNLMANNANPKTYDVTLKSGSAFTGNINLNSSTTTAINIVMEENSKLILSDAEDGNSSNLFVISNLDIQNGAVDQYQLQTETLKQTNNVINIATGGASANNVATRENFRLLAIGNADLTNGNSTPSANTGLYGDGAAVFMTYVNTHANQDNATLGGVSSSGKTTGVATRAGTAADGQYGNLYSDRIIIANIGDNTTAQSGTYYMQFAVDADSKLNSVTYDASNDKNTSGSGGTKTAGNIAVLTVVNTGNGGSKTAGITLKTQDVLQGFDRIGGDLIAVETDISGEAGAGKTGYTTYFINTLTTRGATEATQDVTASAFATNYDLYFANFNSLNKRMGELRDNDNSQGAWARIFNGSQSNDFTKSKSTYTTFQGGYDYAFGFEGANNYLGVAVSYAMSSSKSDLNALDITGATKNIDNVKSNAVEVALYNSYVQDEGWYNDTIAKFSYIFSDFTITGQESKYNTTNMAFTLSDEFGYRFKLGSEKEWYIDPQLEIALGYFNQSDFVQTLGLSSLEGVANGIMTTRARFGSSFGYDFKKFTANKPIKASVYIGAFYEYDYINGGDVTLTTNLGGVTTSSSAVSSDGRVVMNVGTNMTIKDNTRIYFDFESSFAGKINTDYQVNVGVRYSFGENTGYTPMTAKREVAPLKVSEEKTEESKEVENTENNTQEKSTENKTEEKKAQ